MQKWCDVYVDCSEYNPETYDAKSMWQPYIKIDEYRTPRRIKVKTKRQEEKHGKRMDAYPYVEQRLHTATGRWLGIGFFELVLGMMEQNNKKWGMHHKKEKADMGIYVYKKSGTEGDSLRQKVLSDLRPNAVIDIAPDESFERLAVDNKLSELLAVHDKLMDFARQLCGITGIAAGETLPSSTTATTASIMQQNQKTTYDYIIECMHHLLVELFQDQYIDVILDEITEKEYAIIGDKSTLLELDEMMTENAINEMTKSLIVKPNEMEIAQKKMQMMDELQKKGDTRFVKIKRAIVERMPYVVEFFVGNEQFDKNSKLQNILFLLNDPNFPGDKRKLYETFFDLIGEDPKQYKLYETNGAQQGIGGIAAQGGGAPIGGGQNTPALLGAPA